jgi:hypothetical protein
MFEEWSDYFYKRLYSKYGEKIRHYLYVNKNLSWKYIEENLSKQVDYNFLSFNPNINIEDVFLKYKESDLYTHLYHSQRYILNECIDLYETYEYIKYIEKEYNHKINYNYLSSNSNITWDFIKNNLDKEWTPSFMIGYNKNITLKIVLENSEYFNKVDSYKLSSIETITWNDIISHPEIDWNYSILSENKNITFDIVMNHLDKKWNFSRMSMNPNITLDIIEKNKQFDWSIEKYLLNKNVTFDELDRINIDLHSKNIEIIMRNIAVNHYDKDRNDFIKKNNIIIEEKQKYNLDKYSIKRVWGV